MKIVRRIIYFCLAFTVLLACSKEDGNDSSITLTSKAVMELPSVVGQNATIHFHASSDWTASCPEDWISFSPRSGSAGDNVITVVTGATNRTKKVRSTQLVISSGSDKTNVTLMQSSKYAVFKQKEYAVGPEGGVLHLEFTSNLDNSDNLRIRYAKLDWIQWQDESRNTRAEWTGATKPFVVSPNSSVQIRVAPFILCVPGSDGEWLNLDTCYVSQSYTVEGYQSTDFSADGKVTVLQRSTVGNGIPIVIMGDGFSDRDIADSTYARIMEQAFLNIFSEEPIMSLRDYFDVYAVTAVSLDNHVGADCSTAFSTVPSHISSYIDFDEKKVTEYVRKVNGINVKKALAVVITNSYTHNGVTHLVVEELNYLPLQYSIALCALIDGPGSEVFRQVLVHEAVGHGFAKLADEYGYAATGAVTEKALQEIEACHKYNWMTNVDVTDKKSDVLWSAFIGDLRYSSESVGVYEGGYTYSLGVYRPTENSMMNQNDCPFNAPSRKAIYDRVMLIGEGKEATTYEEFAAFDEQHKPIRWNYSRATTRSSRPRLVPPVLRYVSAGEL